MFLTQFLKLFVFSFRSFLTIPPQGVLFSGDTLKQLLRRNSLQHNCNFVDINKVRFKHHQRIKHRFDCDEFGTPFFRTVSFKKHKTHEHFGSDKPFALQEYQDIDNDPQTPRRQSLRNIEKGRNINEIYKLLIF